LHSCVYTASPHTVPSGWSSSRKHAFTSPCSPTVPACAVTQPVISSISSMDRSTGAKGSSVAGCVASPPGDCAAAATGSGEVRQGRGAQGLLLPPRVLSDLRSEEAPAAMAESLLLKSVRIPRRPRRTPGLGAATRPQSALALPRGVASGAVRALSTIRSDGRYCGRRRGSDGGWARGVSARAACALLAAAGTSMSTASCREDVRPVGRLGRGIGGKAY